MRRLDQRERPRLYDGRQRWPARAAPGSCTFTTPGFCTGGNPPSCATTQDTCDARDNNCNGVADEPYRLPVLTQGYIGQPCNSDDGLPPPGHGACRGTGVFQCATPVDHAL